MRVLCRNGPWVGRSDCEKCQFYDEMANKWNLQNRDEMILGLGNFIGHFVRRTDGFESIHEGNGIGKRNIEERRLLEFCNEKKLCVANSQFQTKKLRKIT